MGKYNIETCNLKTKDQILVETYLELFLNISSRIKEEVSMAGNILLNQLFPSDARSTNDLDVCVTTKKIYEEVFSFKKQFNVKKYENLDVENKNMIEQKLLMIKDIQQEISKILEK